MTQTTSPPSQESLSGEVWAKAFVRKSRAEPGFALDEDAVASWFRDVMGAAYTRGLQDGMNL